MRVQYTLGSLMAWVTVVCVFCGVSVGLGAWFAVMLSLFMLLDLVLLPITDGYKLQTHGYALASFLLLWGLWSAPIWSGATAPDLVLEMPRLLWKIVFAVLFCLTHMGLFLYGTSMPVDEPRSLVSIVAIQLICVLLILVPLRLYVGNLAAMAAP